MGGPNNTFLDDGSELTLFDQQLTEDCRLIMQEARKADMRALEESIDMTKLTEQFVI